MNINNWLCKHFDAKKKGYVTIGDLSFILYYFWWIIIVFVVGGIFGNLFSSSQPQTLYDFFIQLLIGWKNILIYIVTPMIVLIALLYVLYYISTIKIARCPLKEQEELK